MRPTLTRPGSATNGSRRDLVTPSNGSLVSLLANRATSSNGKAIRGSRNTGLFTRDTFVESTGRVDRDAAMKLGKSFRPSGVRRWDGNERTTTNWDFLKRVRSSHIISIVFELTRFSRILNFGTKTVIVSYIFMAKGNPEEERHYVSHSPKSNQAIADLFSKKLVQSQYQTLQCLLLHQIRMIVAILRIKRLMKNTNYTLLLQRI